VVAGEQAAGLPPLVRGPAELVVEDRPQVAQVRRQQLQAGRRHLGLLVRAQAAGQSLGQQLLGGVEYGHPVLVPQFVHQSQLREAGGEDEAALEHIGRVAPEEVLHPAVVRAARRLPDEGGAEAALHGAPVVHFPGHLHQKYFYAAAVLGLHRA